MKPPICEVCGARCNPPDGVLVECVADERTERFDARAEEPGFVGHRPNRGWFCGEHRVAAASLAAEHTLPDVVRALRDPVESTPRRSDSTSVAAGPSEPATERYRSGPGECSACETLLSADDRDAVVRCLADAAVGVSEVASGVGRFCDRHRRSAEILAPVKTLAETVEIIRRNDGHRDCFVCGTHFMADTGGVVSFARTRAGAAWLEARARDGERGASPDAAWFCNRHVNPALRIGRLLDRDTAMAELAPEGRRALEYDDVPDCAEPIRDEDGPPLRGPFAPVDDLSFDSLPALEITVAPHAPDRVRHLLASMVDPVASAFGVRGLRSGGSIGAATSHPADLAWAPDGTDSSSTVSSMQRGEIAVFLVVGHHRSPDRTIVAQHHRLLVQRRERSLFEIAVGPADPPNIASDGVRLAERLGVRQVPDLDPDQAARLAAFRDSLREHFAVAPADPLDPSPDLSGIDLGSGSITRRRLGEGSSVDWVLADRSLSSVIEEMIEFVPGLLRAVGRSARIELQRSEHRTFTPMDGTQPPDCPFTDTVTWNGTDGSVEVVARHTASFWNEHDLANQAGSVSIRVHDEWLVRLSAHGDDVATLSLSRPAVPAVVDAIRSRFGC